MELVRAVEVQNERERAEWYRMAWFVSYLLQPHLKRGRTLDPETLLPEAMKKKKKPKTKDDAKRELEELKKSVGIK